jgi:hypothetical protein
MLGEPQDIRAVCEERREACALMQAATVELGQVCDQGRRRVTLASGQTRDFGLQLTIGQAQWDSHIHDT